jgi:hypothetical protein
VRIPSVICLLTLTLFKVTVAFAAPANGQLPLYPNGHNMNADMPSLPPGMSVPMVLETGDAVQTVDKWYTTNAPKACARTTASAGVKYACPSGSIMIYAHGGKTQIAFVPTLGH